MDEEDRKWLAIYRRIADKAREGGCGWVVEWEENEAKKLERMNNE